MKYFGTDGIRGTVGQSPTDESFFYRLGLSCAQWLKQKKLPLQIAIGWDTRQSGPTLANAFIEGFVFQDGQVITLGVIPTPGVAYYTQAFSLSLGAVITASHNHYTDNGIKFFNRRGAKLSVTEELEIENLIDSNNITNVRRSSLKPTVQNENGAEFYKKCLKNKITPFLDNEKIVLDTANGATCTTSAPLLKHWGSELICIGIEPNGCNINEGCGSENLATLLRLQNQYTCLGFAHDGDGDRLRVVDESGEMIDGDCVLGMLAIHLQKANLLHNNTLIVTQQSNYGLDQSLKKYGIKVFRSEIGDREVFYTMEKHDASLGGENSGHIILRNHGNTGDGLIAAVELLKLHKKTSLTQYKKCISLFPKAETSLRVQQKIPLENLTALQAKLYTLRSNEFKDNGRILVRYSGTENKLRFLIEGEEAAINDIGLSQLIQATQNDFKALGLKTS